MDIWPHVAAEVEKLKGKPSLSRAEGAIGQAYQPEQMLTHVRNSPTKDRHEVTLFSEDCISIRVPPGSREKAGVIQGMCVCVRWSLPGLLTAMI